MYSNTKIANSSMSLKVGPTVKFRAIDLFYDGMVKYIVRHMRH